MRLSVLILTGVMAAGILSASVDPGLLALVPADAQLVSGVHVDQSRVSPFGQFVISQIQTHPGDLQKLIDSTGFDPRKDVTEVLMASNGQKQSPTAVVLARGNFDSAKVEATAAAKGATIQSYMGTDLIIGNNPNEGAGRGEPGAVAFLDNTLAVAGTQDAVKSVIANKANTTPQLPKALLAQISTLSATNDAWFVSLVPGTTILPQAAMAGGNGNATGNTTPNSSSNNTSPQAAALQAILQSSGGVHFGDQIAMSFQALTRSDKDAQSLSDVVRFVGSMIQMKRQENTQLGILATAFDGMNLTTSGSTMTLAMSIPEQSFEQLAQSAKHSAPAVHKP
jgi:hypothetical protein